MESFILTVIVGVILIPFLFGGMVFVFETMCRKNGIQPLELKIVVDGKELSYPALRLLTTWILMAVAGYITGVL